MKVSVICLSYAASITAAGLAASGMMPWVLMYYTLGKLWPTSVHRIEALGYKVTLEAA